VNGGGTLVVAGGERKLPEWIAARIAIGGADGDRTLVATPDVRQRWGEVRGAVPGRHRIEEGKGTPLLHRGKSLYALDLAGDDGRIVVLADDLLLTNAALLVPNNARLLVELLGEGGRVVELAGDLTGLVSPHPVAAISHGRLSPALGQLALLLVLFFLFRGTHFGRPTDPVVESRRVFTEHVRALGLQYARAHASTHVAGVYGTFLVERLRERIRLTGDRSLSALAEAVANRTGRPVGEVMRILVESRPDVSPATDPNEALATLRELSKLFWQTGGTGDPSRIQGKV
jgi:hypothetical protein